MGKIELVEDQIIIRMEDQTDKLEEMGQKTQHGIRTVEEQLQMLAADKFSDATKSDEMNEMNRTQVKQPQKVNQMEKQRKHQKRKMDMLPIEVIRRVCNLLARQEVISLCQVSRRVGQVLKERLYRSIIFVDHQYDLHLLTLKKYYNEYSSVTTVIANENSLDMLYSSLKFLNPSNQNLVKELKMMISVDSSSIVLERKMAKLLALNLKLTLLVVPIFKKEQLCFDTSCLRWLSAGEVISSAYDRDSVQNIRAFVKKFALNSLEMLHLRSCNEDFFTKVIQDIQGMDNVTSLRLTGTSIDDDYQQYPNHLEEMANMLVLNHDMAKLNDGRGFVFSKVKHLTIQKFQFAETPYRKWKLDIRFLNFDHLSSLALLNCKAEDHVLQHRIQNQIHASDFTNLEQLVCEHSSIVNLGVISRKLINLKRVHISKGALSFNELVKLVHKIKKLQCFSMNDSRLVRDFHRIFNNHRESNVLFSRHFLNEYQFQPTQPIFKYTEEELNRLLNSYKISTDYIATNYANDVDPFYDIYFDKDSFVNRFFKDTFRPFREDIDSKILPIAQSLFNCNDSLEYVKICGIGFVKPPNSLCYLDV